MRNLDEIDFTIKCSSAFELEQELREYSDVYSDILRALKQANEEVSKYSIELEMLVAQLVEEIRVNEKTPPSAVDKLRKTRVPLDERYQLKKQRFDRAVINKNYIYGLMKAWESRGYRLGELVELSKNIMFPEPRIGHRDEIQEAGENLELD